MTEEYVIGDQVSFYGGRGTIVEVVNRSPEPSFQVLTDEGTTREISPDLPMFRKVSETEAGEMVDFLGGEATVIGREERSTDVDLLYLRTANGEFKKVPADSKGLHPGRSISDRLAGGEFNDPARFSLRERAARLSLAYGSDRFLSLSGSRIRIEPYQVDAAHEVLTAYEPRYLIADEVGLGKTIEAGIIIEELLARGRAERVLIVTPASLRDQWQAEMQDKFGREYVAYDRGIVDSLRQARPMQNVWETEDRIVTSIDFAKQDDMLAALEQLDTPWDVVVFDEAHHLTAREGSDGISRADRYRVGEAVGDNTDALLLLTGTPHKGKPDQFYHLLRLLDPYRFNGPQDVKPEKIEDLMIRRTKSDDSMIDADGEPMFPPREIQTLGVDLTPAERRLYDDLTEYISAIYTASADSDQHAAGFTMVIYQKRLVSSIQSIRESLRNRLDDLDSKSTADEIVTEELNCVDDTAETEAEVLEQLIAATEAIGLDSKGKRLREFMDGVFTENPDEKILVFTEYTDTLDYLRDTVLEDLDVAEVHGGMDQDSRRTEMERFEDDCQVLLATDAAREGLNLQFAHIMVNYDLPWNPIRIDQRMGRLHRYGQDETVHIYNLFIRNTRESDILDLLVSKLQQIESDTGMHSDVLGTVLDDYDVEGAIMDAVTGARSSDDVKADLENAIDERKEAVERIENEFLIRDKFDQTALDHIQDLIDLSETRPIGEDDIERLVHQFVAEFGGEIRNATAGPAPNSHPLYSIDVPEILALDDSVKARYSKVTFARETALERPEAELVSLNHALVQQIVDYCLDGDWIDGQVAALVTGETEAAPGILATYQLGYVSGDGELPTEDYARIYITEEGEISQEPPRLAGALPPAVATAHPQSYTLAEEAESLLETTESVARERVEELASDVKQERQKDVDIKEKHARRYFEEKIREQEDRLRKYEMKQTDTDKDMTIAIRGARSKLEELETEWESEQDRLERERMVIPDEPELINTAVVTSQIPAITETILTASDQNDFSALASSLAIDTPEEAEARLTFIDGYDQIEHSTDLGSAARLFRTGVPQESTAFSTREIAGEEIAVAGECHSSELEITEALAELSGLLTAFDTALTVQPCLTNEPADAFYTDDKLFVNLAVWHQHPRRYWITVLARELTMYDSGTVPEQIYEQIRERLRNAA
ncbi:helicase-related protein [Haloarcula sp. H-GB4]|uniref:helicase-related protein n=1 Tax=Haloarcula sp. H-GB4 TaxID=3069755 RepID=UPI0027B4D753|nr:helicase-related protein [Haloarcula sp. H-GB4]MDQ2074769.1 helicase-related protein [Haloarcula sp. H-GB4]